MDARLPLSVVEACAGRTGTRMPRLNRALPPPLRETVGAHGLLQFRTAAG
jgi:hypothetical protein